MGLVYPAESRAAHPPHLSPARIHSPDETANGSSPVLALVVEDALVARRTVAGTYAFIRLQRENETVLFGA